MVNKIKNMVKGIITGLKTIYKLKRKWEFIFLSVLIWFLYLMMTWVAVFSIPSTTGLSLVDGMFILVIGGLGMSAPVQGGIGAYHWIVSRGLVSVYPFISLNEGLVFATVTHESQSLFAILLGSISLLFMVSRKNQVQAVNPT
jgi:hypothetical protein